MSHFLIKILIIITVFASLSGSSLGHPAWGIVVDNQGQIYVSDLETIWKIDANGRQGVFRAGVSGRHTHELTIDESDNLYGEDLTYEPSTQRFITAIWKMTPAGDFSYLLAPTGDPPKGISIWKDRHGNTYSLQWKSSTDREVLLLKRTPAGHVSTLVGSQRSGGEFRQVVLSNIGGMTFGADGSLYLTDRASIQKVTMAGMVTTVARNIAPADASNQNRRNLNTSLSSLSVDDSGNIYAADFGNRRVLKITSDGTITTLLDAEESWSPSGVAFKNGDLYILETGNAPQRPRLRKLSADGKVSTLAIIGENTNPPARETPASAKTEPAAAPKVIASYWLIGLCASIVVLSFVIWRLSKRKL